MRSLLWTAMIALPVIMGASDAMAIEKAKYDVIEKDGKFEIRDYGAHIVAETVVDADLEDAANEAFRRLFGYISGKNRSRGKIAMTAPVSQEVRTEKIAMTAPVGQARTATGYAVNFLMPSSYTMEGLPEPEDSRVKLRRVPARRMAAVHYSGRWTEKKYRHHKEKLETWTKKKGLKMVGEAVWARYNPPFTPSFLRRNEVLIELRDDD